MTDKLQTEGEKKDFSNIIDSLTEALNKMRFGSINIIVHENKVVQLDITERLRFQK